MIDVKYTLGLNTNQFCDGGAGGCKRNDQKSELPTKRVRIGPSSGGGEAEEFLINLL